MFSSNRRAEQPLCSRRRWCNHSICHGNLAFNMQKKMLVNGNDMNGWPVQIQDWAKRDFKKCEIFEGWLINWAYGM